MPRVMMNVLGIFLIPRLTAESIDSVQHDNHNHGEEESLQHEVDIEHVIDRNGFLTGRYWQLEKEKFKKREQS